MAHRHKRDTNARRKPTAVALAGSLAVLATGAAVVTGTFAQDPASGREDVVALDPAQARATASTSEAARVTVDLQERQRVVSRYSGGREGVADAGALGGGRASTARESAEKMWTTDELNLWSGSGEGAEQLGVLDAGEQVAFTGTTVSGRDQVIVDGETRWVTTGYLDEEKPAEPSETSESGTVTAREGTGSAAEGTDGACTNGTSVPSGVDPSIVSVHQAVCARWPEITGYGTFRSDGEHGQGRAIDIMVTGSTGWDIAEYLRANYSSLGIEYLIYEQKIWSVQRSGEGWRGMEDRGSVTANHYDHVHVTVY